MQPNITVRGDISNDPVCHALQDAFDNFMAAAADVTAADLAASSADSLHVGPRQGQDAAKIQRHLRFADHCEDEPTTVMQVRKRSG